MPSTPNNLSLENIANGAEIKAQPLRDNYTEIQTEFNKVVAILDGGAVGQFLKKDGAASAAWADIATSYGTSLPGSPSDGQEAILVDSTSNPTYQWRFRYNAGSSSSYKWEFVGGAPKVVTNDTDETTTSASYVDFTNNVQFTIPLAGDWLIHFGATTVSPGTFLTNVSPFIGATATDADSIIAGAGSQPRFASDSRLLRKTGLAAASVVKLQWKTGGGTPTSYDRFLAIQPIRVG
jgi:hypothetical protein